MKKARKLVAGAMCRSGSDGGRAQERKTCAGRRGKQAAGEKQVQRRWLEEEAMKAHGEVERSVSTGIVCVSSKVLQQRLLPCH